MAPRAQISIQTFARVSKPSSDIAGSRKRKQIEVEEPSTFQASVKKQKYQLDTPPETPTKAIKRVLSSLKLSVPTPSILRSTKRKRAATPEIETPPTPESNDDADTIEDLYPEELDDLKTLNSSFLKALALHYAHNGVATPVDVRILSPTVTKAWGKRKVTFDDIRTCLGITYHSESKIGTTFSISNYGNGKFCIEMEARQRKRGVLAQAFDEAELNTTFEKQLDTLWRQWSQKDDAKGFIKTLPRATITECVSYTKLKPTLAKGQQRLEEVLKPRSDNVVSPSKRPQYRQFPAFEKASTNTPVQREMSGDARNKENTTPPPPTTNFRALSLLDRIQKKQELQAENLAHKPTQASLDRRAALQRCEEMIQILELLATTKGPGLRASFPLPALVRSIQSSLRSPMSSEEIDRCIVVIGKEVAPGYVEKKEFGSMKGVVVNRIFKPEVEKVRQAVEGASN
jgi:hypothetical protein